MRKILIISLIFIAACNTVKKQNEEEPLAMVHDKYLYRSDLNGLFGNNISKDDSVVIARNFINEWIKKQLLVRKAELYLSDDSKDIEREIEDYRSSLLIFKYQQELIKQKIDTVVTDSEIEEYYNEYSANFVLNHNIVKVLYLKISKEAPEIEKVKWWYKSSSEENKTKLEEYCYQYATIYDDFDNEWVPFSKILLELPTSIDDQERFLKYQKYIETEDDLFHYFVKINEYNLKSTVQPLEYAKSKIKSIVLNKRKFNFLEELENSVYNDALNHNEFIIY